MKKKKQNILHSELSRRDFLGLGSLFSTTAMAGGPLANLMMLAMDGLTKKALAQEAGKSLKTYFSIQQYAAPNRLMHDLFIDPYNTGTLIHNPNMATNYVKNAGNDRYIGTEYRTTTYNSMKIPLMWSLSIATSDGGNAPMTTLLDNMLAIQGINTTNGAHTAATKLSENPNIGKSIHGHIADHSSAHISSFSLANTNKLFLSKDGKSQTVLDYSSSANLIERLMEPYTAQSNTLITSNSETIKRLNSSLSVMDTLSTIQSRKIAGAISNRKSVQTLLKETVNDFSTQWTGLIAKYEDLISRTIALVMASEHFGDLPIGSTDVGARAESYHFNDGQIIENLDLRSLVTNPEFHGLAQKFAVAEYVIVNNLSHDVSIGFTRLTNIATTIGGVSSNQNLGYDIHNHGGMVSLLPFVLSFACQSACLNEMKTVLKYIPTGNGKNRFDETLFQVGSEFNRNPRINDGGSDHGWEAGSMTLMTGGIDQFRVIGNIYNQHMSTGQRANYPGSWGHYAPVAELDNTEITYGNTINTISNILGAGDISNNPNHRSLVRVESSGKVVPLISNAKMFDIP